MRVLLVEDSAEKRDAVLLALATELDSASVRFVSVSSASAAKSKLRSETFELLILDIALPELEGGDIKPNGGIELLREITTRNVYKRPGHVIGLTGRQDVYAEAASEFGSELWSVVFFDQSSEMWVQPIIRRIRHVLQAQNSITVNASIPNVYACIVVAVESELQQMKANGWVWTRLDVDGDASIYFRAEFTTENGFTKVAVLAQTPLMGMSAASVLAAKMCFNFRPTLVLMPGICAGDSDQVAMGDLIVGNPVWDYGSGKKKGVEVAGSFEPAPYQISISTRVRGLVQRLAEDNDFFSAARDGFQGGKPSDPSRLHIGPFASGAAVVANKAVFRDIQLEQHRKLLGIDMEAYGVLAATIESLQPQPECLVIKAVSDFADIEKGDRMRNYGAYLSGMAITHLLVRYGL